MQVPVMQVPVTIVSESSGMSLRSLTSDEAAMYCVTARGKRQRGSGQGAMRATHLLGFKCGYIYLLPAMGYCADVPECPCQMPNCNERQLIRLFVCQGAERMGELAVQGAE